MASDQPASEHRDLVDPEMRRLTEELIRNGTTYNLSYLDRVYHDDLTYVRLDQSRNVELVSKQDNMEFFGYLRDSGAEPLSDYAEFHYADSDGSSGYVVLTRRMERNGLEQEFLFNIHWEKIDGEWKIVREIVFLT